MSQKKMEAYKEAKKNVKQIRKKEKRKLIIGWIVGILCAAVLIGASVFLIYYTNVIKPEKEQAALMEDSAEGSDSRTDIAVDEITNILNNSGSSGAAASDSDSAE